MQCTSPLIIRGNLVRCGQCTACRVSRSTEWAVRCLHERALWRHACFATLTYRDDRLPRGGSLDLAEFTKFWKRLRFAAARKLRYYGCGEYGEERGRPHYHAIVFGVAPWEKQLVERAWGHGQVMLGTVTMQSCRYVADYVGKSVVNGVRVRSFRDAQGKIRRYGSRTPPFAVMSQGIGRGFVDGNREQLLTLGVVTVGGRPVGLPRYYRSRLVREVRVLDDLWVSDGLADDSSWGERFFESAESREQRERNISARGSLRKKGVM